ncbi:KGGVGR-motif variant AAA ATPase [Sinorhizobium chiapasense]|uniref:TIR domain-containing protein n=1 Tax=Sinorhizobium chiapasense TaxID=501572 RepID=A0ABZ2BIL7_9HYPH
MRGSVVTFYSYKGGVGRSFALVNVAALLGRWGFRVLCIDWDLEAPGLEAYFRPYGLDKQLSSRKGLVELFQDFDKRAQVPLLWRELICPLDPGALPGVELIKSGLADAQYTRRVQQLNWDRLYKKGLGEALETMFDEFREIYDFILVDARTGVTDFSGVITAQLPDVLAFLFTANEQSVIGASTVARRAVKIRNDIALDRSRLLTLPIPARFEAQVEHRISQEWRERFVTELQEFYAGWAGQDVPIDKLVPATTIPYVPFWSFGEKISVVEDPSSDQSSINFALENIAALLAHKLGQTRLLVASRDEFVGAARRIARDPDEVSIFLSYSVESRSIALRLEHALQSSGLKVRSSERLKAGEHWPNRNAEDVATAHHFVLLLGPGSKPNRVLDAETRTFLRQSASDESPRMLIPFRIGNVDVEDLPPLIRHFQFYDLSDDADAAADKVIQLIRPTKTASADAQIIRAHFTAEGNIPIAGVEMCAIADNGTTVTTKSDSAGHADIELRTARLYRLLLAHSSYLPRIITAFDTSKELRVRLERRSGAGSSILHSTGHIPGLEGRLNPVMDTLDRTYLYAENIAIDGGKRQPVDFAVDQPFILEDRLGSVFRATVRFIEGRTTLVEYEKVTSHIEKLVVLRSEIDRTLQNLGKRIVQGALNKNQSARFQSSRELAENLVKLDPTLLPTFALLRDFWPIANAAIHGDSVASASIERALQLGGDALVALQGRLHPTATGPF